MRISKTNAFISALFIAFLFFCIGRFAAGGNVKETLTIETERGGTEIVGAGDLAEEDEQRPVAAAPSKEEDTGGETPAPKPDEQTETAKPAKTENAAGGAETHPGEPAFPININTATAEELDALPGIGEALAQRIIEYRQSNGAFSAISDIKRVDGIGDGKYEDIKDLICTQ